MPRSQLDTHISQFFAYATLVKLDRLTEANVGFTFRTRDLYLSALSEGWERIRSGETRESDPALLIYAQLFERFAAVPEVGSEGVNRRSAALTAAAFYWLAGYGANARVISRALVSARRTVGRAPEGGSPRDTDPGRRPTPTHFGQLAWLLTKTLSRDVFASDAPARNSFAARLLRFVTTGSYSTLELAREFVREATATAFRCGDADEWVAGQLLDDVLLRLRRVSLWDSVAARASAPQAAWRRYASAQARAGAPLVELWPSQRTAVAQGILDGRSSLVLRMPTSAGKTKLTELTFVNDLAIAQRRCLYLAPFRALVTDVQSTLSPALARLGLPVATLYGGTDANELEVALSQQARVVIATPEKMTAVLRLAGGSLTDFGTIVVDEGHLVGDHSRGAAFELQLSTLLARVESVVATTATPPRIVFLSAVLPNSSELASWIAGDAASVAVDDWKPTVTRVAELVWGEREFARLNFLSLPGQDGELAYFVPKVLQADTWREQHPTTKRFRTYVFPDKNEKSSIAAAFAFRVLSQGSVIVFAAQPRWAESIAGSMLERLSHTRFIDAPLIDDANRQLVADLAAFAATRLGSDALLVRALVAGIGIHHGGVPQGLREIIEDAFRERVLRVLVATSTIAQGVNFPARTVILHSMPQGDAPIRTFWNLAGRAGRATQETEGELVILRSETLSDRELNRFLNAGNVERAESQILRLVRQLAIMGQPVSDQVLESLREGEQGEDYARSVEAIDASLMEQMVEDVDGADSGVVERLARHLLATQQARSSPLSESLSTDILSVLSSRSRRVRSVAPSSAMRQRYSRTALKVSDAVLLDDVVPALREYLTTRTEFDEVGLSVVVSAACLSSELREYDPDTVAVLAHSWTVTGEYQAVLGRVPGFFASIEKAIEFVEDVFAYRLSWILSGLVRLLEQTQDASADDMLSSAPSAGLPTPGLPEWVVLLPQYVRYGVSTRELLWAMTLGVQDRGFAEFTLAAFEEDQRRPPSSFLDLLDWLLSQPADFMARTQSEWPAYFVRLVGGIVARYGPLRQTLARLP